MLDFDEFENFFDSIIRPHRLFLSSKPQLCSTSGHEVTPGQRLTG